MLDLPSLPGDRTKGVSCRAPPQARLFLPLSWEGTPPATKWAHFGVEDSHLELTLQILAERLGGLLSANPSTTVPDCSIHPRSPWFPLYLSDPPAAPAFPDLVTEAKEAVGIIHSGGPQRPQRVLNASPRPPPRNCVHSSVSEYV